MHICPKWHQFKAVEGVGGDEVRLKVGAYQRDGVLINQNAREA